MAAKKKNLSKPIKFVKNSLVIKILIVIFGLVVIYFSFFIGKIYPGVTVAGIELGGKTPEAGVEILKSGVKIPEKIFLKANSEEGERTFEIQTSEIELEYDVNKSIEAAYLVGRNGNPVFDIKQIAIALFSEKTLGVRTKLNEEKLQSFLSTIAGQIAVEPIYPSVKVTKNGVEVQKGQKGENVDTKELRIKIGESLAYLKNEPIEIPKETIDPTLNSFQEEVFRKRAEDLSGKSLSITFEFKTFSFKGDSLLAFLDPLEGYREEVILEKSSEIAGTVNRKPQNPAFVFEGGRVKEFAPAKEGVKVDTQLLKSKIIQSLETLESQEESVSFEVPVETTKPDIETEEVNNLGIKELIGRGSSHFRGSIASRIYNINLAATRINGVLVKPGEVFSFNQSLGDVSKLTGYKEAYVIQDGKTVLGDGGGVCQVSTTLFRAVLNAGLPIVERRAHSYRVGYYEQDAGPGLDATVYAPSTDFKFKNDTPAHILIQAYPDTKNLTLVFELYGTNDGRVASISKPVILSSTAPGPDLYIDDPTLPLGVIRQTEHRAYGAKTSFSYKVERAGEPLIDTIFYSNYRPWQAVYLRGTGPVQ